MSEELPTWATSASLDFQLNALVWSLTLTLLAAFLIGVPFLIAHLAI